MRPCEVAEGLPYVFELRPMPDPEAVFLALADWPRCVFFDSAARHVTLGRYSFVAADPFDWFQAAGDDPRQMTTAWEQLAAAMRRYATPGRGELPPFQGGAAGLLGYELAHAWEQLPRTRFDEFGAPALALGLYDVVVAFDHVAHRAWIVSQGFPELESASRRRRAEARLHAVHERLRQASDINRLLYEQSTVGEDAIASNQLSPQFPAENVAGLTSNFSREAYLAAVARVIEYIRAGDVFQVNLSQRLLYPARSDPVELYLRLRHCNAAPFAGYFDLGPFQIASASPERFLQLRGGTVETRPIKGTRQRTFQPEADLYSAVELQTSEKDRAENVMIVDLLRNDLSRVCSAESVRVTQLCQPETCEFVQHLVSAVEGRLRPDKTALDLVRAAFPGGSITGAPKIRSQQIIAELEPTVRGAYCGALGYFSFGGAMDTSILIRTITAGRGWWQAPVGGGITAQSVPTREYAETWHKAEGLLRAMV